MQTLAAEHRLVRARDFAGVGVPHSWLQVVPRELRRVARGVYVRPEEPHLADPLLVLARKYPGLTVGLTSALWMHGVLSWRPPVDWWVLSQKDRLPSLWMGRAEFVRSSWPLDDRVEVRLHGLPVPCHSPARAVLECVRFRARLGVPSALEALGMAVRSGAVTIDELKARAAEIRLAAPLRRLLRAVESGA